MPYEIVKSLGSGYGVFLGDRFVDWFETIFDARDYITAQQSEVEHVQATD